MTTFNYTFIVNAPLQAVSDFHHDTRILKKLSPPPVFVQIHDFEPLADGSVANFTLWMGPIPLRWRAIHHNVTINGFTDVQDRGPLAKWEHAHRFTAVSPNDLQPSTQVHEQIEYQHKPGLPGLFTRLLFNNATLYLLFTARKFLTRWHVKRMPS